MLQKTPSSSSGRATQGYERRLSAMLDRAVRKGTLSVHYPSGAKMVYGNGDSPISHIRLVDADAVRAIYLDPALKFAEMYMDGRMVMEEGGLDASWTMICNIPVPTSRAPISRLRRRNSPRSAISPRRCCCHRVKACWISVAAGAAWRFIWRATAMPR